MTARDRIAIGGLGGVAPVLVNLIVVDMVSSLAGFTLIVGLAYAVRVLAMVGAGAIAGWLHEDEVKPTKVFQLGMVAPALLTGMMNGAALRMDAVKHEAAHTQTSWSFFVPLHAQVAAAAFQLPQETVGQQVMRGVFGITSEVKDWVLQVEAVRTEQEARLVYGVLTRSFPSLRFVIFRPSAGIDAWLVTVGEQMTQQEAAAAKEALKPESGLVVYPRHLAPPPAKH